MNSRLRSDPRPGFTLVELLVVIAIIGVLVALLLPAVQAARAAARRSDCLNRIKQIATAVQNYHSAHSRLPDSHNYDGLPRTRYSLAVPSKSSRGWITLILPYMEQQAIYDQLQPYFGGAFDKGTGINHPDLAEVVNQPIAGFRCPDDAGGDELVSIQQYQWQGKELALTNYKGVLGNNRMGNQGVGTPDCHRTPDCDGLFWRFSHLVSLAFNDITDGLSQTLMIGEDLPRHNFHCGIYHGNGDYSSTHFPPNINPEPPNPADWPVAMTFRSDHPGGLHFARADGSASFMSDSIDFDTYRFLSTRNGAEILSDPAP
jgi:prepilin-type N-terminal cleavage/methylation domain-containing protein